MPNTAHNMFKNYDIYDLDIIGNGEEKGEIKFKTDICYSKQISTKKSPASV